MRSCRIGEFRVRIDGLQVFRRAIILSGRLQPTATGSRVVVTTRLSLPAMLFLLVAVPLLAVLFLAVTVLALVRDEGIVLLIWTAPFAMWGGVVRPFQSEARKIEDGLRKLFPPPASPHAGPFR
jgi:hypothetical protein